MIMAKRNQDHLNDMLELQKHQYDPGYYTGGNFPPEPGNPRLMAYLYFIVAAAFMFIYFSMLYGVTTGYLIFSTTGGIDSSMRAFVSFTIFWWILILLCIWIGIRYLLKARRRKKEILSIIKRDIQNHASQSHKKGHNHANRRF